MKRRIISLFTALVLIVSGIGIHSYNVAYASDGALESVGFDLNGTENRAALRSDVFIDWVIPVGNSTEYEYEGVTYKLSSINGDMKGGQNKTLSNSDGYVPKLTCDGAMITIGSAESYLRLEITGLAPGTHSFASWHSIFSAGLGNGTNTMYIELNGEVVEENLVLPSKILNDDEAAIGYFSFNVEEGKTVTIDFKNNHQGLYIYPILNAFELDGPHPLRSITNTYPENADGHFEPENGFSWTAAKGAVKHDVYIGEDIEAVLSATKKAPEYKGTTSLCKFDTSDMEFSHMKTYYWRVDEVFEDGSVEKGTAYSFGVAHLAFPTAEGYGRFARGGRGGEIVEVTNLNDSGEGSLRWALEELSGPRIVVFKVGGVIELKSKIIIKPGHDNVYVAGQTAPGDGITLTHYSLGLMGAEDVIIRNMRVRVGDASGIECDGMGMASSDHSIIDHCSISWSTDEGFSSRGANNITFQKNIIAEALHDSVHYDANNRDETENHSFAGSISGNIGSVHHNLMVHCAGRNFSLAGGYADDGKSFAGYVDVRNNIFYNFRDRTTDGGVRQINFVSNYYKMGPESPDMKLMVIEGGVSNGTTQSAYAAGNMLVGMDGKKYLDDKDNGWTRGYLTSKTRSTEPFFESYVTHESAEDAYESVTSDVGAKVPALDYLDTRYLQEVINTTYTYNGSKQGLKGIIDSQEDVGGYPDETTFKHDVRPDDYDTDHDGMPDTWEKEHGLNPEDYEDAKIISLSAEGYTNIEMYLNELMGDPLIWAGDDIVTEEPEAATPKPTKLPIAKETATPEPEPTVIPESTPIVTVTEVPENEKNYVGVDLAGNEARGNLKHKTFSDWCIKTSTTSSEMTINDIKITITSESGTASIVGTQNKTLANDNNNYYLSCDGLAVMDNVKMIISGLSEGVHTFASWHNFFKNEYTNAPGLMDIYINGNLMESLSPTYFINNDDLVGIFYNTFEAKSGEDVIIEFKKATTSLCDYIVLNGFEIDGKKPVQTISNIYPVANEENHDPLDGLSWTAADVAVSHDVYLGTDSDAVLNATHSSGEFKGNQTETSYSFKDGDLQGETFYWRVDEVDSTGTVIKGKVNMFTIRHLAFPSALNEGRFSKIARGGRTVLVTTLEDTGAEGSLRWALECEKDARIVVFNVSGDFVLDEPLTIPKDGSNIYVAAQTAPDGEVNIVGYPIIIESANNVVIRNMKFSESSSLEINGGENNIIDSCGFYSEASLVYDGNGTLSVQNNRYDGSYIGVLNKYVIDTDKDGMPDEWEMAHGLDISDKYDARSFELSKEGYTNLEMYLNELMDEELIWNDYAPTPTNPPVETPEPTETPVPTDTPEPGETETVYILGDVDNDSDIDATDALLVLKHAAKLQFLLNVEQMAADVTKNDVIDASDALEILKYAARLIDSF